MSHQLRKSASFRSRIPVRRSRQRRFCSPPPQLPLRHQLSSSSTTGADGIGIGTSSSSSVTTRLDKRISKIQRNSRKSVYNSLDSRRRCSSSSSSFSSSDESCYESEAPHMRLAAQVEKNRQRQLQSSHHQLQYHNCEEKDSKQPQQQQQQSNERRQQQSQYHQNDYFNTSTDAISLDGLLDSVSSGGSFSSPQRSLTPPPPPPPPPPPDKYQNLKIQKLQNHNSSSYDSLNKNYRTDYITENQNNCHFLHRPKLSNNNNMFTKECQQIIRSPCSLRRNEISFSRQQQQHQQQQQQHLINNVNGTRTFLNTIASYSDEDNSNIDNYNNKMNRRDFDNNDDNENHNRNYSSNIDLLTPLRSPFNNRHYPHYHHYSQQYNNNYHNHQQQQQQRQQHRMNQRKSITRRDNHNESMKLKQQQQQRQTIENLISNKKYQELQQQHEQQQQQQHREQRQQNVNSSSRDNSPRICRITKNAPSSSSSSTSKKVTSTNYHHLHPLQSAQSPSQHPQHPQQQPQPYHHHHHHHHDNRNIFNRDHMERFSFKNSVVSLQNTNNENYYDGSSTNVNDNNHKILIQKRDKNLNDTNKTETKQIIMNSSSSSSSTSLSSARKLENILSSSPRNQGYMRKEIDLKETLIETIENDNNNNEDDDGSCGDGGDNRERYCDENFNSNENNKKSTTTAKTADVYDNESIHLSTELNINYDNPLVSTINKHELLQQRQMQYQQQQQQQQQCTSNENYTNSSRLSSSNRLMQQQQQQQDDLNSINAENQQKSYEINSNWLNSDVKSLNENHENYHVSNVKYQIQLLNNSNNNNNNNWSLQKRQKSIKTPPQRQKHNHSSSRHHHLGGDTSSSSFEHINLQDNNNCSSDQNFHNTRSTLTKSPTYFESNSNHNFDGNSDEIRIKQEESKRKSTLQSKIFPPTTKTASSYRSDCELSGSYVSLECPSPPGPPACLPESRRDPQARLGNYLKTLYIDLALKEPIIPPWAIPVAPGALCPARLEPEFRLHSQSHGFSDCLTVDQLLSSIHTKEGTFLEAPRRVLIECPSWTSRCNLSLRILYAWAKEPPWPPKGTPVALALFIPLNEIKRSLGNFVEKELLPKGPLNPFANGFGGFSSAWNSLESLGPKLLIILDGYDTHRGTPKRKGKHYPSDIHDLLDGKIFPQARVIITTSTINNSELLPLIQRHVTYEGLTWGRSASLLGGGQWGASTRLLDTVQECQPLRKIVRTPLGCLAVAAIFEATAGDLPTDELDVIESVLNCVAPETTQNNIAELGRLALFCLKMKRPSITMSEIRMYCSTPDSTIMGCLDKELLLGKTARKKGEIFYNPICPGMIEFLAANYIASLVNRPGLLAAEITGLSMGDELEPDLLKVIKFAMGLLGTRAHILLSKLTPLWFTPQTIFSLALAGGSSDENLSALCDILGISKHPPISPLETKPIWVQIRSVSNELLGWGMALKSPSCTLKNLEVIYQIEKHTLLDSRNAMETFLDSLTRNESVSTLRISSLIENDVKDSEINYLANCVSKALMKPRLENFELVLTLLEEDPPVLKLQSAVTALCRSIPRQPKLTSLVLDLGLSTSQLVQLCSTLEKCPNVTRLSLPHLRCERGAVSALASLLTMRPLSFLALPSCWGARDDPPSSSGVSMGSGSGSSTGTSGLIKQGSLTGVPSPRSYPPGIFSSLPRGVFVPTATMGRSATLPRQPMEPLADKRSSDSVVSKTWYPTPACDGGPHNSGTLHDLLLAAREPFSKLHGLDLSKAQLSLEDSMCLGETVRLSNTLHTLKLEGSSRLSEILPAVLGASESPSLQMLSIGSPRLNLEDPAIAMSARSLTSCSTLRLLSLDGWSFRIENPSTLSILRAFLSLTSIRELSLSNCRLQIGIFRSDTKIINAFESRSVVVLKLSGAQAILADSCILRGPQLLNFIGGFPCLRELDLSAPARSGFGTTVSSPLILDDKCLINFFQSLHTYFSLLNTLKMCNWVIHFDDAGKTLKYLSKCIRNSPLSHLKLDGISVLDRPRKLRIESQLYHCFIASLPLLRWMGISLSGKKDEHITSIGNSVLDLKGYEIDIKLSESTIEQAKLMAQAISLDGKFDIKVSTFGTSSGILIHAEKSGAKSLNRK